MKENQLTQLFNEWKSGRIKDFTGLRSPMPLTDVPDYWVIATRMPVEGTPLQALSPDEKANPAKVLHAFSHIDAWPLPNGQGSVVGNIWVYGPDMLWSFAFPTPDLATEFNRVVVDLPGTEIMKARDVVLYLKQQKYI
jgi:hypothetical protein